MHAMMPPPASRPKPFEASQLRVLSNGLLEWYRAHRRPLPWRLRPSLYSTVVSEFMCQQTRVETVLPYFDRWMAQFPDFAKLAVASEAKILRAWEGLGYYSRARNLHRLAAHLTALDAPPQTAAEWRPLPGIGPYTAAAVASIAFGEAVPVVDGNVVRVLARLCADDRAFRSNQEAVEAFRPLAEAFLDRKNSGDHNQAIMELGATVCRKSKPACLLCPLRTGCRSAGNNPETLPRIARRATVKLEITRLWIERDGHLLLHEGAPNGRRLRAICELPSSEDLPEAAPGHLLNRAARAITHHRMIEEIRSTILRRKAGTPELPVPPRDGQWRWVPLKHLDKVTLSGPHRKWIQRILENRQTDSHQAAKNRVTPET